ncbi:MAG: hypothetical protein EA381_20700 [Planctomycetaceae bacterium]|nr:MAG: hypothetical protein EA381_20700 [Planctomycetaceae bacterium]
MKQTFRIQVFSVSFPNLYGMLLQNVAFIHDFPIPHTLRVFPKQRGHLVRFFKVQLTQRLPCNGQSHFQNFRSRL